MNSPANPPAAFAPLSQLLACQPVCSVNHDVIAFDLPLQSDGDTCSLCFEDLEAVIPVALESYASVVREGRMLAIPDILHLPLGVLRDERIQRFPRKQFILETSASDAGAPDLAGRLETLFQAGYRLAMGDIHRVTPELDALLPFLQMAAVDTAGLDDHQLQGIATQLRERGVDLLARGVDTRQQLTRCLEAGFTRFQGRYLNDCNPVPGRAPAGNRALLLQLLARLHQPDVSVAELEQLAIRDPALTYRLLRLVNSAAVGNRRQVDTLSQAITLLGTEEILRWIHLFLVEPEDSGSEELTRSMLVRARMSEIIAGLLGRPDPASFFVTGLLSRLDLLMEIPLRELLEPLPISAQARDALLYRRGSHGAVLAAIEQFEQRQFDSLDQLMDPRFFEVAFRHATSWARQAQLELHGSRNRT